MTLIDRNTEVDALPTRTSGAEPGGPTAQRHGFNLGGANPGHPNRASTACSGCWIAALRRRRDGALRLRRVRRGLARIRRRCTVGGTLVLLTRPLHDTTDLIDSQTCLETTDQILGHLVLPELG